MTSNANTKRLNESTVSVSFFLIIQWTVIEEIDGKNRAVMLKGEELGRRFDVDGGSTNTSTNGLCAPCLLSTTTE